MALGAKKNIPDVLHTGYSFEGQPITLNPRQGQPIKKPRHAKNWFPEETKLEAATLWAATRNFKTVSAIVKVSEARLRKWRQEPWFQSVVDRVVRDHNDALDEKLTQVIHKSADMLIDRLEHGDHRINYKTGEQFRAPMDARGLTFTMGILFDKRQLLRGEATSRTESVSSAQKLEELKDAFLKFSEATTIEGEVLGEELVTDSNDTDFLLLPDGIDEGPDGLVSEDSELQSEDSGESASNEGAVQGEMR